MYKITYAIFHSDKENTFEASSAAEIELETNDVSTIHQEIDKAIIKDESYRGYKIVRIEPIVEEEKER